MQATSSDSARAGHRVLIAANLALLGAIFVHGADHFLQERGVGALATEVVVGGQVVLILALISLVLAVRRHPRAPLVSAVVGFYIAAGVTASHFVPHWSAVSDPYADLDLGFVSWAAAGLEVLAALAVGTVGVLVLRGRTQPTRSGEVATG